ncbi:MAG: AMIN domain-containing protein [Candidatus Mcinerneyibacterium aminivorans]|uniref:AMIN domain-containing protein n=1 Tax=Candidatus Mcinerneyibacterium aminivorans TaxID=2703815 RepID=A0A5D0MC47_9BACT|nr:MAG: AMIN domain-containing protein [Candidatus Mcinerneyibacterium aminivorans]
MNEYKNLYQITISFEKEPVFNKMILNDPYRIVVDIEDSTITPPKKNIYIDRDPFQRAVVAQFDNNTVRFVLELTRKLNHTVSKKDNSIVVTIKYPNEDKIDRLSQNVEIKLVPRESSITLSKINIGTNIKVLNQKGKWALILLPDGQNGWIKKDNLDIKQN